MEDSAAEASAAATAICEDLDLDADGDADLAEVVMVGAAMDGVAMVGVVMVGATPIGTTSVGDWDLAGDGPELIGDWTGAIRHTDAIPTGIRIGATRIGAGILTTSEFTPTDRRVRNSRVATDALTARAAAVLSRATGTNSLQTSS